MHSFLQRLNVVFFFYVSVMGVVSGLCALTVFPMWYESPPLDISLKFADGILDDLMVRAYVSPLRVVSVCVCVFSFLNSVDASYS